MDQTHGLIAASRYRAPFRALPPFVLQNKILRVKSLGLKSTGNRKRPLDAMTWALSPDLKIAVKVGHPGLAV
jgi:hypothetical protein